MILIFKGFDIEAVKEKLLKNNRVSKLLQKANTNRKKIKYVSLGILACGVVITALGCAGVTVGFKVNYSGKNIAVVESREVIDNAFSIATQSIADENADEALVSPECHLTLTVSNKFENAAELADTIIENTADLVKATALKVDGKTVACVEEEGLSDYLEAHRTAYYIDGAENTASFVSKIETEEGYYLKSDVISFDEIQKIVDGLEVKTVSVTETKITVDYKTVKKTTTEKSVGYSEVITAGCNGVTLKTESVESINGKETSREEISSEVLTNPVDEVILVGTGISSSSSSKSSGGSGLICPLSSGSYYITAYFGDGRNHKGMDFSADKGTSIYAAGGGTVTYAGYDSDFGYNVIIQHSNGIKTRYAHASSLCVSVGQVVSQGDVIATVGCTGWSTGNHLHFELIINGNRVDPAPYINLY